MSYAQSVKSAAPAALRRRPAGRTLEAASQECDRVEALLHEAADDLYDELGIVGLRLHVERVSAETETGARIFQLCCGGEAAPRATRDAILVIRAEGVRVLVNDPWGKTTAPTPLSAVDLETMSDLLLAALEGIEPR